MLDLARLRFVETHENCVLVGPPGVGKSHLAKALGLKAISAGYRVYFTTVQDLVDSFYATLADGSFRTRMHSLMAHDVIILDELGFLPMDATASNHLFRENVPFMWIAGRQTPDFRTINRFRSERMKDLLE